jgi:3-hydroxyacyl-[acyl-carrier-protein] dehydratase
MRFLWVDRVVELHRARRIVAALEIPRGGALFAHHFPLRPMFPASLLFESAAQAGTILLETSLGFRRKALPGYIAAAKFYRAIVPGDSLLIEIDAEQWSEDAAVLEARIARGPERCAWFRFGMLTAPLGEFYGAEHAAGYRAMYAVWLGEAALRDFAAPPQEDLARAITG